MIMTTATLLFIGWLLGGTAGAWWVLGAIFWLVVGGTALYGIAWVLSRIGVVIAVGCAGVTELKAWPAIYNGISYVACAVYLAYVTAIVLCIFYVVIIGA